MGKLISYNEYKVIDVDVDEDTIKECFIDLFDNYDTDFAVYTEFYYVGCSLEYSDDIDKIAEYMDKRNAIVAEMNYSLEKLKLVYPAVSYKICEPTLVSNDNFRTDTRYRKFSMMIGKKFDKIFEGMYADLLPEAKPLVKDYEQFVKSSEVRKQDFLAQLAAETVAKRTMVRDELEELHKSYINVVSEIMVDVEDWHTNDNKLDILGQGFCWRFDYEFTAAQYRNFEALQDKLNDILGEEAYDVCYVVAGIAGNASKVYGTGSWLNRPSGPKILTMDNLEPDLIGRNTNRKIEASFLFKAIK